MAASTGDLYSDPCVFDRAMCDRIRQAMDAGVVEDAEVLDERMERREDIRRAASIEVPASIGSEVERALDGRRDALAGFFGIPLGEREGAGFLRYPAGGFYAPHVDRADVDSWPAAARRSIAIVVFLNGSREAERDGTFEGGVLRLFASEETIEIAPRAGLLVAFRADILHEVTAVRGGTRDAIVDWFYDREPVGG
jgi:predicted 2-oxoglutarate/Fe(II)-dependent dioxygenase YbiX